MMFIRANADDLNDCLPCAESFHKVYDPDVPFSKDAFLSYWKSILYTGQGFMIMVEHRDGDIIGGVGGVIANFMTSDVKNCIEMFWWVDPEFRGEIGLKLYREFESEAKKLGAERLLMAYMNNSDPDRLAKFYKAKGFTPWEYHVIKDI